MEAICKKLNGEVEKIQGIQKELQKCLQAHRQLSAQLSENDNVKEDLSQLDDSNNVYKLVGPVLLKQNLEEARETVRKRIGFISAEL
ncbi:hypothetical protein AHF37_03865 [Paragonimus kellicotti]|nr:hypothetical protein AHF37_03865 [Paragonimus kellicotti]